MNYVDEEQMDVMAFEMGQTRLRGSRFADKVEDVGRGVVSHFQEASKDQEGWYDDALRLAGGGLKNVAWLAERPGIKQGLQVLGSGGWAGGKLGEAAAQRLGIDPRLGKWTGGLAGDIATGGVLKKGAQIAKTTKQLSKLSPLESGRLVTGGGFGAAPVGPRTKLGKIKAAATMDKGTREAVEQAAKHVIEKPRDMIGLKENILNWYKKELKNRNLEVKDYHKIKREQFGGINVAGSDREISQIGKALKADDASLMSLPKATTRRRGRLKRTKETAAPEIKELHAFADEVGIPATTDDLLEFKQWATTSFKSVQDAAKKQSKFRSEYHAGHLTAAQSKTLTAQSLYREGKLLRPPTTGSAATIELGVDNIRGSNRAIHDINPIAARQAGVPTTWAETFKQWWKIKQGQPQKSYFTDFTNAERQIIESIPYNAKRSEVMKTFEKIYKNRQATNPDLGQYTSWSKDLMRGVEQTQLDVFGFDGF